MGSFITGLVGSYAQTMLKRHADERAEEDQERQLEITNALRALNDPTNSTAGRKAASDQIQDILEDYGVKHKKGFSLRNLVGHFADMQGNKQKPAPSSAAPPQPGTQPPAAPQDSPVPSRIPTELQGSGVEQLPMQRPGGAPASATP